MKWTNKGHQFDEVAKEILSEESKYYLWGKGAYGLKFYEEFNDEIEIIGFVDINIDKQNNNSDNIPTFNYDVLNSESNIKIIVTCSYESQIFPILEEKGFKRNKDFFMYSEFTSIYKMYKYNKLNLFSIAYQITEKCTLMCTKCVSLTPHLKKLNNTPKEKIMKDLESTFKVVDNISVLSLSGGDTLLYPDLDELLEKIGEKYYKKGVSNIEIMTNAVIFPSDKTIELIKKYSILVRFSDYGKQTKDRQKIDQFIELMKTNGIAYDKVNFTNWVDFGYPQQTNNIKNLPEFFDKCNNRNCNAIYDNKIFNCAIIIHPNKIGHCNFSEHDYFDLSKNSNKKELLEFFLGYTEKGYLEYCKKCNGSFNVNNIFVEAGKQV